MTDGSNPRYFPPRFGVPSHSPSGFSTVTPQRRPGTDSFVIKRPSIEVGQTAEYSIEKDDWSSGAYFCATDLVYIGSPGLWILKRSSAGGRPLFAADIPCETFGPGCPTAVAWPLLSCFPNGELKLLIENRGKELGHFLARLAGNFDQDYHSNSQQRGY